MPKKKPPELIEFGKKAISIRLDNMVIAFFKSTGARWQSRVNYVLRQYVERNRK
jgi:uncharacterized protein (DUF4415 family)